MSDPRDLEDDPEAAVAAVRTTRSRMRETLGSLGERISPGGLVETAKGALLDGDHEAAATVFGFIRRHPVPIALSTAGLAWLGVSIIRDGLDDGADEPAALPGPEDDFHGMPYGGTPTTRFATDRGAAYVGGDRYGPPTATATARRRTDRITSTYDPVDGERVVDAARAVRERASEMADATHDAVDRQAALAGDEKPSVVSRAVDSVKATFAEHPVLFGVAGLAVGALAGILIPRTARENMMVGHESDAFARRAKAEARDLVERGKAVAREGIDAARREFDDLTDDAKHHGRELLDDVKDAARQTGESVKDAAERQAREKAHDFPHGQDGVEVRGKARGAAADHGPETRLSAAELFDRVDRPGPPPVPPAGTRHPDPTIKAASPAASAPMRNPRNDLDKGTV